MNPINNLRLYPQDDNLPIYRNSHPQQLLLIRLRSIAFQLPELELKEGRDKQFWGLTPIL